MTDTTSHDTQTTDDDRAIEKAIKGFAGVGLAWARYGIHVGSAALEASAKTLRVTADTLNAVSSRLGRDVEREDEPKAEKVATEKAVTEEPPKAPPEAA